MTVCRRNLPIKAGEVSSKNNEEPVGKVTRSSYSYQSPKDKDSLPSITSSTTTSVIGSRRSSGPKIEEITDSDSTFETNRRYSKEYTVEEDEAVADRRSSAVSVEGNVKTYTSILKNSSESGRRSSGPRITDVTDVNSEQQERRTSITTTISSRVSPDNAEAKSASSNRQQSFKNEDNKTETQKKVITRGDSVKALQHKFQQATVTESTDSTEDAEARALLNKFLGASVILQGMEQGMRAAQKQPETEGPPTAPSSAALVIQAEKQRVKVYK
ncbi:unnamed protein product [Nezara viridula]|uniref:Uncharacterized protein n=1 Tax=Nezara viridula TaxID=85310 RepID=A0A9P0MST3_NEZVI|nr:unnamed protein product [Nezara viridula]